MELDSVAAHGFGDDRGGVWIAAGQQSVAGGEEVDLTAQVSEGLCHLAPPRAGAHDAEPARPRGQLE